MIRTTSKAAIIELNASGTARTKRAQIFQHVGRYPGTTRARIARAIPGMTINCASGRVRELLECGALIEHGCEKDPVTGRSANRLYINPNEVAA